MAASATAECSQIRLAAIIVSASGLIFLCDCIPALFIVTEGFLAIIGFGPMTADHARPSSFRLYKVYGDPPLAVAGNPLPDQLGLGGGVGIMACFARTPVVRLVDVDCMKVP